MKQRTVAILGVILIVILLGVGVFNAFKSGQSGAKPRPTPVPEATPRPVSVLDYVDSDDAEVRLTTLGRIVAKESHIDETISILKARRNIYFVRAYSGTADPNVSFDNNQPAFEDFMRALNHAGFTAIKPPPKAGAPKPVDTEVGLCPGGQRYIYEIIKSGQSVYRAWSTSCNDPTTFGGAAGSIKQLFNNQIPNYNKIVSGVKP